MNSSQNSPRTRTRGPLRTVFAGSRVRPVALFILLATLATAGFAATSSAGALRRIVFGNSSAPAAHAATKGVGLRASASGVQLQDAANAAAALNSSAGAPRRGHTATLLDDGRVLVVGGDDAGTALVFDAATATHSVTGGLSVPRFEHTATKLADGRVLVVGGRSGGTSVATTELYNTTNGSFEAGPSMGVARAGHSATVLSDGKILVAGGDEAGSAEVYDPASNSFGAAGAGLSVARSAHAAALMKDGRVLLVGGRDAGGGELESAEIYDGSGFGATGNAMAHHRVRAHLRVLPDGKVQVIGGNDDDSMEVYDPAVNLFGAHGHLIPVTDPDAALLEDDILGAETRAAFFHHGQTDAARDREGHTITEIPQLGKALVFGGANTAGAPLNTATVFSSSAATVTTDKLDYLPGQTATISGTGWQPGETVNIILHEDPHTHTERRLAPTADAEGKFTVTYLVDSHDFQVTFIVGAKGASSGRTAQTTFTDGNATATGTVKSTASGNPPINGATITCTAGCNSASLTTSNATGNYTLNFQFSGNGPTTITLTASAPGFTSQSVTLTNVDNNESFPNTNFLLTPSCTGPSVTVNPTDQTVTYGAASVSFTATVSGSPAPTVQWQQNTGSGFVNIPSATGTTLNITAPTVAQSGTQYRAVFTNSCGTATSDAATLTVTPKTVTPSVTANDKTYDATTTATLSSQTLAGVLAADTANVSLSVGAANFSDKNVGNGKTVTATGLTLTGSAAGNYQLSSTTATTTADITAATVTGSFTANDKTYDATTAATIATRTLSGVIGGDGVTLAGGTATFDTKNVGSGKTVTGTGFTLSGADAGNYTLSGVGTTTANITPATLTGSFTANDRTYDGATDATIATRSLAGVISPDVVSLTGGAASFADKHVGVDKTVTGTGFTLSGGDAGNYVLASTTLTTTADITPASLTGSFTAANKIYDGTTAATITGRSLVGAVGGDDVSLAGGTASFADKHAGNGKTVTLTGASLAGADAGNYVLDSVATATASITPRALTVSATGVNKVYDGTTSATVTLSDDRVSGDDLTVDYAGASFADPNVGTAKPVTVSGICLNGADAGNYTFNTTASTSADITPRSITVTADPQTKVYGDADPSLTRQITSGSLVAGDAFTGALTRDAGENVGSYAIEQGTLSLGGNYDLTYVGADFEIAKAPLTITAQPNTKTYDADTNAAAVPTVSGLQFTDTVTGLVEVYDNRNAGTGKTLSVSAYTVNDGNGGNNYTVSPVNDTTGVINKAPLTITAQPNTKTYDGTDSAAATPVAVGAQGTDTVTGLAEAYDTKHVGTGKTLSVTAYTVSDGNSGNNYTVSTVNNTAGVINKRAISVTAVASTKIYDGTTSSSGTPTVTTGTIAAGDTGNFTQTFDNPLVGTGKTLTPAGSVSDGNGGNNYQITLVPAALGTIATSYCFNGFLSPIGGSVETSNGGSFADPVRAFKLGSTIPVKFALSSWNGTACGNVVTTGVHTLQAVKYNNAVDADAPLDATPTDAATAGNVFRLTDSQWHFNLSTKAGFTQGTWLLRATLQDGSVHTVWVTIKK